MFRRSKELRFQKNPNFFAIRRAMIEQGIPSANSLEDETQALKNHELADVIWLKRRYAGWLILLLSIQFIIVDVAFFLYASIGENWKVPTGVIQVWLSATVVELIGVVLVVTKHLFPERKTDQ